MNQENKISVVINTYNAERDLEQVLRLTIRVQNLLARLPSSRLLRNGCWWWMLTRL